MTPTPPLVELRDITKRFGDVEVLRHVSLTLSAGEVHALVGENGAGKSTLVKILAGVYTLDGGLVLLSGAPVTLHNPAQAQRLGFAIIHQQPSLFPDLDVAENIYMGRQPLGAFGRVDWRLMYREVNALLRRLDARFDARTPVKSLSIADQQLIEIAKALSMETRLLVMDEPTAALSAREVEDLFTIVRQLRAQGVAILFISHRFEEIFDIADRVTVLRDGAVILTKPTSELSQAEAISAMVGREMSALYPKQATTIGPVALKVQDLSRAGEFRDVSFEIHEGEILGFAGLVGAGRTEVARAIFGLTRPDSGTIQLDGKPISNHSPTEAMSHGIAYVPEDRYEHGLVREFPIAENVTLPIWRSISNWLGIVDLRRERAIASDYFQRLQIHATGIEQIAQSLSGGNQQKVVIAKWLATKPRLLILDEPTRGVDIGAKAEVHRLISQLASEGLAIMMISSELPEALAMSDRIIVMSEGRITGEFKRSEATQERIMLAAMGQSSITANGASVNGTADGN
jgi:rhamnose transport system ATP-binding protein